MTAGRLVERLVISAPAVGGDAHRHRHAAPLGELERIRQQVLEHLLEPRRVGVHRRAASSGRARR